MSTNETTEAELKAWVEKGRKEATAGRNESAWEAYSRVFQFSPDDWDEARSFQFQRALVNAGVLARRIGDQGRAENLWKRAIGLGKAHSRSGLLQATAVRAKRYLALGTETEEKSAVWREIAQEYGSSELPEVHQQLLELLENDPQPSGVDSSDRGIVWLSRVLWGLQNGGAPPADFEKTYWKLRHSLRQRLAVSWGGFLPWAISTLTKSTTSFTPYLFESSSVSQSVWIEQDRDVWVTGLATDGIVEIHSFGKKGWTWITKNGSVFFWSELETIKRCVLESPPTAIGWNPTTEEWLIADFAGSVIGVGATDERPERVEGTGSISLIAPLDRAGFLAVETSGKSFFLERGRNNIDGPVFPKAIWTVGTVLSGGEIILGNETGLLMRYQAPGDFVQVQAHQGRVLNLLGEKGVVLSCGEDGRVVLWKLSGSKGFQKIDEKNADGPVFLAKQNEKTWVVAGGKTIWSFDRVAGTWAQTTCVSSVQALFAPPSGPPVWADKRTQIFKTGAVLRAHTNWVVSFARNAETKRWVSGCLDGTICEWDDRDHLKGVAGFDPILGMKALIHGVVFVSQSWIRFRDWQSKSRFFLSLNAEPVTSWSVNQEGTLLFAGTLTGRLGIADLEAGAWIFETKVDSAPVHLHPHGDGVRFFLNNGLYGELSFVSGRWSLERLLDWGKGGIGGARWSENGLAVVWGADNKALYIFDPAHQRLTASLEGVHKKQVNDAVWEEGGKRLWTAGSDGKLVYWDAVEAEVISLLRDEKEELAEIRLLERNVLVRPDGKNLLLVHRAGFPEMTEAPGARGRLGALAVNRQQNLVLTSSEDGNLRIHTLPEGGFSCKLPVKSSIVHLLDFHPEVNRYVAACRDGSIFTGELTVRAAE